MYTSDLIHEIDAWTRHGQDLYLKFIESTKALYEIDNKINYAGLKLIVPGGAKAHPVLNTLFIQNNQIKPDAQIVSLFQY